jgi:hypothetical protein
MHNFACSENHEEQSAVEQENIDIRNQSTVILNSVQQECPN